MALDSAAQALGSERPLGQVCPINGGKTGTKIFCVHPADGGVRSYLELAQVLEADADVYGVSAYDLAGKKPFPPSVNAAAQGYANEIQREQPKGPYVLVGYSLGGHFAFEIARELTRRGEAVADLFIIDSHAAPVRGAATLFQMAHSNASPPLRLRTPSLALWTFFIIMHTGLKIPQVPKEFWSSSDDEKCEFLLRNCRDARFFLEHNEMCRARTTDDIRYMFDVLNDQCDAVWNWERKCYSGPIHYIKCVNKNSEEVRDIADRTVLSFWRELTSSDVNVTWLQGRHDAALSDPAVHVVAGLIRDRLKKRNST